MYHNAFGSRVHLGPTWTQRSRNSDTEVSLLNKDEKQRGEEKGWVGLERVRYKDELPTVKFCDTCSY